MLSDALVLLIFIILIIAFFAYFMIKDKENLKRIMILEQTLDEFTQDLHYLKKDNVILSEIKAKLQEEMDQKIDTLQLILEDALNAKTSLQIDARILPILESLKEVELIIKDFQADQQNRILDLEQRTRSISKISPNFDNEEAKVIAMSKAGKSIEQIAKDMKLGVGRVELILKFNKKRKENARG